MLKATIDASVIQEALKIATKIAPPMTGNVVIEGNKGTGLTLLSIGEANRCYLTLPSEFEGRDLFAIAIETLRTATRGRDTLKLNFDEDVLVVSSGRYENRLATVDVIQEEGSAKDDLKYFSVSVEQAEWLDKAIAAVAMRPTVILGPFVPVAIRMTDKGTFVASYGESQIAYARTGDVTGHLDLNVPIGIIQTIISVFGVADFEIAATESTLYIRNQMAQAEVGLPAENPGRLEAQEIMGMIKAANDMESSAQVRVDAEECLAFLDNAKSVIASGSRAAVQVAVANGRITMKVATSQGEARGIIRGKASGDLEFKIDYDYFTEFVHKGADSFKLVGDNFVIGKTEEATLLVMLNGEDA